MTDFENGQFAFSFDEVAMTMMGRVPDGRPVLLELFSGSGSIGRSAERMGFNVFSLDLVPDYGATFAMDYLEFDLILFLENYGIPDAVWASPPCTSFATVAGSYHRDKEGNGKTEEARIGDLIIQKLKVDLKALETLHGRIGTPFSWFVENPRGRLQNLGMKDMEEFKTLVHYCSYGDTRQKPTNIWTNCGEFEPRPRCKRGDSCHESGRRMMNSGTVKLRSAYERSKIPEKLCDEVVLSILKRIEKHKYLDARAQSSKNRGKWGDTSNGSRSISE